MKKKAYVSELVFAALHLLNAVLTIAALRLGAVEGNPLLSSWIETQPVLTLFLLKAAIVFGIIVLVRVAQVIEDHVLTQQRLVRLYAIPNVIMLVVVINNLVVVWRITNAPPTT